MGCATSSLAGPNDFKDIDATPAQPLTWRTTKSTPDPIESPVSAEAYTHTMPTMTRSDRGALDHTLQSAPKGRGNGRETARFGSHAYMGSLPFTGNPNSGDSEVKANPAREPKILLPHDFHIGHSKDAVYGSAAHPKPRLPNGKRDMVVPFPSGKGRPSKEEWEAEQTEKARVKAERAEERQLAKLGKMQGEEVGDDKEEESEAKGRWKKWMGGGSRKGVAEGEL
jgi:hypothetical protein